MAIKLGFLIEKFFVKLSFQVFYRDFHTDPYKLSAFPHTELGAPVLKVKQVGKLQWTSH